MDTRGHHLEKAGCFTLAWIPILTYAIYFVKVSKDEFQDEPKTVTGSGFGKGGIIGVPMTGLPARLNP